MSDKKYSPQDVRNRTRKEAMWHLYRAEMTYLHSAGWQPLCGTQDSKCWVAPKDDYKLTETPLYTISESLKIQKEKDGYYD